MCFLSFSDQINYLLFLKIKNKKGFAQILDAKNFQITAWLFSRDVQFQILLYFFIGILRDQEPIQVFQFFNSLLNFIIIVAMNYHHCIILSLQNYYIFITYYIIILYFIRLNQIRLLLLWIYYCSYHSVFISILLLFSFHHSNFYGFVPQFLSYFIILFFMIKNVGQRSTVSCFLSSRLSYRNTI